MLLFLDVISPLPELLLIEDNKVILKRKIIKKMTDKLSDNIFETYTEINKSFNLNKNLKKISITLGPGSFTSLRVGAAFVSGLIISNDLLFSPFTINDIFNFNLSNFKFKSSGIFINSGNNQNFFCVPNKENKVEFFKLEDNSFILPKHIDKIFYNKNKFDSSYVKVRQVKFSFLKLFYENYHKLEFLKGKLIKPIYISNNKILN